MLCLSERRFNPSEEPGSQLLLLGVPLLLVSGLQESIVFNLQDVSRYCWEFQKAFASFFSKLCLQFIYEGSEITRLLCLWLRGRGIEWSAGDRLWRGRAGSITESFVGIRSPQRKKTLVGKLGVITSLHDKTVKALRRRAPGSLLQACLLFFLLLKMSHHLYYFLNSLSVDR